jgi:hypothetical protein
LLSSILPTPASDRLIKELARNVQDMIRPIFPDAEVAGFATGDIAANASMGMAVPDVDLVVSISLDTLPGQLEDRLLRTQDEKAGELDARKVQKSAIRACMERLVSEGGFKFRRSAFKGPEPKVTLLAPLNFSPAIGSTSHSDSLELGDICPDAIFDERLAVPVDLSVNTATPECLDAVFRACSSCDPDAGALIALVRRWARDRGICHSAKGYLSPYAWSLLAAFFLQVAPAGGTRCLPPLRLRGCGLVPSGVDCSSGKTLQKRSMSVLFRGFVHFYHEDFNWQSEVVCLDVGRRAAPERPGSFLVVPHAGPYIHDPFEPKANVGASMTAEGFSRTRAELGRAVKLLSCSSLEVSLAELLEPWVAPHASPELSKPETCPAADNL